MSVRVDSKFSKKSLIIRIPARNKYAPDRYVYPFTSTLVPFAYGLKQGFTAGVASGGADGSCGAVGIGTGEEVKYTFSGNLREEQTQVATQAIDILNRAQSLLLSTHVGFGKTVLAIYLLSRIGLKTIIISHRLNLLQQWLEALESFLVQPRVQYIRGSDPLDTEQDIFVINVVNVSKIKRDTGFIGLVIIDEVHLILSEIFSRALLAFQPQYLVGLSATPYRLDQLDQLFEFFFGGKENLIYKPLHLKHHVFWIATPFVPEISTFKDGTLNWDSILRQQAEDEQRNELIVRIVQRHPEHKFLILCRRVAQVKILEKLFCNYKIQAVYDSHQPKSNTDDHILIGTSQKLGVGFDDKSRTALILAGDVKEYFVQYQGRLFRNPNATPVIFDIVDIQYGIFKKHFNTRLKQYKESGGIIQQLDSETLCPIKPPPPKRRTQTLLKSSFFNQK